ncbi:hypothetical protein P280DRAFT_549681 [Massarina eburnea CBS 473.64]|uniref:Uncharacterized protein n=1 Tax=Massarina eburnea CBS 473.64 TaxID=1395130 RepID=A0A6A6S3C5_9PLEO|nr:hypothetical protein P280DRAFT_549681 [Massarina eburnea CBS 473.64]
MQTSNTADRLEAFNTEAQKAAKEYECLYGALRTVEMDADDLPEDSTEANFVAGGQAIVNLTTRFLTRLAAVACGRQDWNAPTLVLIRQDQARKTVALWIAREGAVQAGNGVLWHQLADLLTRIHDWSMPTDQLWYFILDCFRGRLASYVKAMRPLLEQCSEILDDLTTQNFGILNEPESKSDIEVGDRLTRLRSHVCATPVEKLDRNAYIAIIRTAFELHGLPYIKDRLRPILGSMFARKLFRYIQLLAYPRRCFNTAVRTTRTLETFSKVTIRTGYPSFKPITASPPPPPNTSSPSIIFEKCKHKQAFQASAPPTVDLTTKLLNRARIYLPPSDHHLSYRELLPADKRATFLLAAVLLDKQNPDPEWDSYHLFGYSACSNEHEVQLLGGLLSQILTQSGNKVAVFDGLWRAVSNNSLASFLDSQGWSSFRSHIPYLDGFLRTRPKDRESVWRLLQFTRTSSTDPIPCLIRDYGFQFCRTREEVVALRNIYAVVLAGLRPLLLHHACVSGQLLEAVLSTGVTVRGKQRRWFGNRNEGVGVGYEGLGSGTLFGKGLFRGVSRRGAVVVGDC